MSELNYKRNGDYLLPDMGLTEAERKPLGKYGIMRQQYLEKNRPGLYVAGELLDVNAYTGGYNLQIAFSTAYVAGQSAAAER